MKKFFDIISETVVCDLAALNNITPNRIADLILVQTNIFRSISLLALCATVIFYLTSIRIRGPVLPIFSGLVILSKHLKANRPGERLMRIMCIAIMVDSVGLTAGIFSHLLTDSAVGVVKML